MDYAATRRVFSVRAKMFSMKYFIVGLGNPGEEYKKTRHNTGFLALEHFRKNMRLPEWVESAKVVGEMSEGEVGEHDVVLVRPHTFMNKSGSSVKKVVKSKATAKRLVVVHDDLDLPVGKIKIVFGRGSGGHRGVDSIVRAVGTKDFVRVRIGVAPATPTGKLKKPKGEKAVLDFIMKDFRKPEMETLKKTFKDTTAALETIVEDGYAGAANRYN